MNKFLIHKAFTKNRINIIDHMPRCAWGTDMQHILAPLHRIQRMVSEEVSDIEDTEGWFDLETIDIITYKIITDPTDIAKFIVMEDHADGVGGF